MSQILDAIRGGLVALQGLLAVSPLLCRPSRLEGVFPILTDQSIPLLLAAAEKVPEPFVLGHQLQYSVEIGLEGALSCFYEGGGTVEEGPARERDCLEHPGVSRPQTLVQQTETVVPTLHLPAVPSLRVQQTDGVVSRGVRDFMV